MWLLPVMILQGILAQGIGGAVSNSPALSGITIGLMTVTTSLPAAADSPGAQAEPRKERTRQSEDLVLQREQRLIAHSDAFIEWTAEVCDLSDDQRMQLQSILKDGAESLQKNWARDSRRNPTRQLPDFTPIEFTNRLGPASRLFGFDFQQSARFVLSADQYRRLTIAIAQRDHLLLNSELELMTEVVDSTVELTPKQREGMRRRFAELLNLANSRIISLSPDAGPLTYHQPGPVFNRISELRLSSTQNDRLMAVSGISVVRPDGRMAGNAPGAISLDVVINLAEDDNPKRSGPVDEAISEFLQKRKSIFEEQMQQRVEEVRNELQLTDAQVSHLRLAARGAIHKYLAHWRQQNAASILETCDQAGRLRLQFRDAPVQENVPGINNGPQQLHIRCRLTAPMIDGPPGHPIWIRAIAAMRQQSKVDQVEPADRLARREKVIKEFVFTTIDRELWLTTEQRATMRELVGQTFESAIDKALLTMNQGNELNWLEAAVFGIPERSLQEFLNSSQLAVWQQLRTNCDAWHKPVTNRELPDADQGQKSGGEK